MELSKHELLAVHPENSQRADPKDIDHDRNGKSGGDQEETEPPAVQADVGDDRPEGEERHEHPHS